MIGVEVRPSLDDLGEKNRLLLESFGFNLVGIVFDPKDPDNSHSQYPSLSLTEEELHQQGYETASLPLLINGNHYPYQGLRLLFQRHRQKPSPPNPETAPLHPSLYELNNIFFSDLPDLQTEQLGTNLLVTLQGVGTFTFKVNELQNPCIFQPQRRFLVLAQRQNPFDVLKDEFFARSYRKQYSRNDPPERWFQNSKPPKGTTNNHYIVHWPDQNRPNHSTRLVIHLEPPNTSTTLLVGSWELRS